MEPGPGVTRPIVNKQPKLKYPKQAKKRKMGTVVVVLDVLVDEKGKVVEAKIKKPVADGIFDKDAIKAAKKTEYHPATSGTTQVKMWTVLPLTYREKK